MTGQDGENDIKQLIVRLLNHLDGAPSPVREHETIDTLLDFTRPRPHPKQSFIDDVKHAFSTLLEESTGLDQLSPLKLPRLRLSPEPRLFKICLLGDGAVGKTSLRRRYVGNSFIENYIPTIGADFSHVEMTVDDYPVQMTIWDLAGQPRFQSVKSAYFLGSMGAVVVFDVTRLTTFFNMFFWIDSLFRYVNGSRPLVLVANKIDLVDQVDPLMPLVDKIVLHVQRLLHQKYGVTSSYLKTSALTGENVRLAFREMIRHVLTWLQEQRR